MTMYKIFWLAAFLAAAVWSCQGGTSNQNPAQEADAVEQMDASEQKDNATGTPAENTAVYSHQSTMHAGNHIYYLRVEYAGDAQKINAVYYYTNLEPDPIKLTIHEQEFVDGEISGYTATVSFPGSDEKIGLGLIEDRANLSYPDGTFLEFEYEGNGI